MTKINGPDFELQKIKQNNVRTGDRQRLFEDHIRRWHNSGLTQTEYCRRNDLKWSAFHYWRKRLAATSQAVTLVQVPIGLSGDRPTFSGQGLTLVLGGRYKVEIGDHFNPATLIRLVETLQRFS
jgi:hypothetical protein